jgi:erythritol kinase (D-erythritol 1-phosphate-forming)
VQRVRLRGPVHGGTKTRETDAAGCRFFTHPAGSQARRLPSPGGGLRRLVACGGGTRSRPWLQVFADVLGVPLEIARTPEVGARGALLAAAGARGDAGGAALDIEAWTAPEDVVEPDAARRARYDEGYGRYLEHVKAARPFWATRQAALAGVTA